MDVVLRMCSVCFRMRPKLNEEVEVGGSWKSECSGKKEQRGSRRAGSRQPVTETRPEHTHWQLAL